MLRYRGIGNVEIAIPVDDVERVAEMRQRLAQSAAGAEEAVAVDGIADLQAEAGAVADEIDDLLAPIADAEDDARDALALEKPELWLARRRGRQ